MNDCMTFPDTVEEFMEQYKVVDTEHIYTNGSEFVPIFRMKQWFEHLPSAWPKPYEDAVSREAVLSMIDTYMNKSVELHYLPTSDGIKKLISILPSAQPECKVGKWIRGKSWSEGAGMGESYGHYWKCNQCNNIVKGDWSQCGDNFCSECGADMRGKQNG